MGSRSKRRRIEKAGPSSDAPRVRRSWPTPAIAGVLIGLAAAGLIVAWLLSPSRGAPAGEGDIILITIDTLRADALGFAGNSAVRTPFLDRLAEEGLVFTNAHAHNVVTLPSHANILTGLLPYEHGIRDNAGFVLDSKHATLATMLKAAGYATGAFVGAFPLDRRYGLNQGFDVYDDEYREGDAPLDFVVPERSADEVLRPAMEWFESVAGRKRFLWIHLYDPHAPYRPPASFAEQYRDRPYLGEVAATDEALARFLTPVIEKNPGAMVLVTSDHGEALGDHGELTHGLFAYEATLKVPLIVHAPRTIEPSRDDRYVRHIDIVPTLLNNAGVTVPSELKGTSLLENDDGRDTYFEALSSSLNRGWAPLVGMIHGGTKYIDLPIPELYDLPRDPREERNMVEQNRRMTFRIRALLEKDAPSREAVNRTISEEEGAKLLSLGYLTGNAAKKNYTAEDDPKKLVDVDRMVHEVIDAWQRGDIDRAAVLAEKLVERRSDMPLAREMLAFVLQQKEKPEAAIATLEEAIRRGVATDAMKIRLGLVLSESGRAGDAVEVLAPFADRQDPEMLNAYGIALADTGRMKESVRQFERVLALDATNATAYQNLGVVALRAGDIERARAYLLRALSLNDRLPLALNTLGVVHAREGNDAAALDAWGRAVAADPRQYDALFNMGLVAARSGRPDIARRSLERFISVAPPERYASEIAAARQHLARLPGG